MRVLIIGRKHIYIAIALIIIIILASVFYGYTNKDKETFTEIKYAYKKISPTQAKILLDNNSDFTIIDVRSEKEFLTGHIDSAILLPYKIAKKKYSVMLDKNKKYLVYCSDGKKSEKIAKTLADHGYSMVYTITEGIAEANIQLTTQ